MIIKSRLLLLTISILYADVYQNGIWERNLAGFAEFCREEELTPELV
jgi:hypothetical protein